MFFIKKVLKKSDHLGLTNAGTVIENIMAAMLESQSDPPGIELYYSANFVFRFR